MELDDDDKYDLAHGSESDPPDYPSGLRFTVREADFEGLGIDGSARPGETIRFAALARATNVSHQLSSGCRIEAEIDLLALGEGQMCELDQGLRPSICLTDSQLERADLDDDVASGDMVHLIGTVRVEGASDTQWGGKCLDLQIVELAIEDEDAEG
jgi:hypothetical protein